MCEKRYRIQIAPGAIGTFNTPNPHPETLRILKNVVRMAMESEAAQGIVRAAESGSDQREDGTPAKPGCESSSNAPHPPQ